MNKYKILILLFLLKGGVSNGEEDKKSTEGEKTQQTEVLEDGADVNTIDFTEFKDFLIQEGEPEATEEELQEKYQMLTENQKRFYKKMQGVVLTFTEFKDFFTQEEGPEATEEELQVKYSTLTKSEKFIVLSVKQIGDEIQTIAHLENENPALFEEKENELMETFMTEVLTPMYSFIQSLQKNQQ